MSAINDELRAISDSASETLKALLQMAGIVGKPEEHNKVRKLAQNTKKLFNATLDNRNLSLLYKGQRTGFVKCTTQDQNGKEYTAPMKLQLRKKGIGEEGELTAELNAFQVKPITYIAPEVAAQLSTEQQNELTQNKFLREPVRINIKGVEKDYLISIDPDLNVAKLRSLDAVKADIQKAGIVNEETINRFIKGEKIEYDADGKPNVAFYDAINFQFVSRPVSVDKALNFNRTVREDNANDDSVTANYRQAIVFEYEGKNGVKEQRAFMLKNAAQGIPVKELYQHIEKTDIGKGMKIQGLTIEEAIQKGVKITIQGNDLVDKFNPNIKYILDVKNPSEATIMRKAFYEATQAHQRATEQLENKQHISLEAKDLKMISTKVVDEKQINVSQKSNEVVAPVPPNVKTTETTNDNDKKKGTKVTEKTETPVVKVEPVPAPEPPKQKTKGPKL